MKVKMYEEKLHKQEEKLGRLSEELANKCNTTCLVTELQDMEQLLARQRARSEELEGRLMEVCGEDEVLKVEVGSLNLKVRALEEECEERNRQASAWYQALQEVKDQNVVLSKELEMMQLQSEDDTHQKKGNSLFGEVEDRRREIELQMMTLQVKYDTMDKTHTFTKQQLKKLKSEMSALLCRHGATTADVDHMHRLQRQVEQLKSENQQLEAKVSKLSKLKGVDDSIQHSQKYLTAFVDFGDKEQHMKILQQELEREKSAKSSVCKELELKRLQAGVGRGTSWAMRSSTSCTRASRSRWCSRRSSPGPGSNCRRSLRRSMMIIMFLSSEKEETESPCGGWEQYSCHLQHDLI
eukprot:Em0001g753a